MRCGRVVQSNDQKLYNLYTFRALEGPDVRQFGIDDLDRRIISELAEEPRLGMLELSRRLGVARGTVTARLDKLQRRGVITGFGPDLDLEALGFTVQALSTGDGDLLVRLAARSNPHLLKVLESILQLDYVDRASSVVVLATPIPYRTLQLVTDSV